MLPLEQSCTISDRVRADDLGVTLEAPPGWHVRSLREPRCVALVPDCDRDRPGVWLTDVLEVSFAPQGTLEESARAKMGRYVRQGRPHEGFDRLFGRPAMVYRWTDGVRDQLSWFVAVRGRVLEIGFGGTLSEEPPDALLRRAVMLLPFVQIHDDERLVP